MVPLSCRLWGLGKRRKLPLGGLWQSPGQKQSSLKEHIMMATNCLEYGITVNNVSVLQYTQGSKKEPER